MRVRKCKTVMDGFTPDYTGVVLEKDAPISYLGTLVA